MLVIYLALMLIKSIKLTVLKLASVHSVFCHLVFTLCHCIMEDLCNLSLCDSNIDSYFASLILFTNHRQVMPLNLCMMEDGFALHTR